ncbi:MAG: hypothetical protein ACYDB2_12200 [Acidimicrobiales bacterium]
MSGGIEPAAVDDVIELSDDLSSRISLMPTMAQQVFRAAAHALEREDYHQLPDALISALGDDANLISRLISDRGILSLTLEASNDIRRLVSEELEIVEVGLGAYLSNRATEGLMSNRFLCSIACVSIAAGVVTVWVPPHAHAGAAVKYGITTYVAAGCGPKRPPIKKQTF